MSAQTRDVPPPPSTTSVPGIPSPASSTAPAETYQAIAPGTEQYSGGTLLVEAYAALWIILVVWLLTMWRKQAALHARIDDLEKVLALSRDRSETKH